MKVSLWKAAPAAAGDRPKTGQPQSIRGKISAPIPIPSPADDEFPMRHPGTGIATPLTDAKEPLYQTLPTDNPTMSVVSVPRAEVTQAKNADSVESGSSPTSVLPGNSPQRRTNPASTLRYSAVSAASEHTKQSQDKPQRKKSTLRGALGKLFGRKKKSNGSHASTNPNSQRVSTLGGSSQHRSDPSALSRALTKDGEPKRSASLPITEYDRALRSHSIGPQDITAIESARNSLQADPGLLTRRRAATTTSQLYMPFRNREGELAGLSPRPASTHARASETLTVEEDPNEIGRAITSDIIGLRRRSRSLNGLTGGTDGRPDTRRRSDEIRYWRESYDPAFMSPMSSNAPDHDDTGVISVDLPEPPEVERAPATPPQPFTFGNVATMNVMAGMKITQAAGLELRIDNLEARMRRIEKVVTQLANIVPGFKIQIDQPDRAAPSVPASDPSFTYTTSTAPLNPAIYQTVSQDLPGSSQYTGSLRSKDSHMSFGEAPTYIGSIHLPPPSNNRPTSNATIRGATSLPAIPHDVAGPFTTEHYNALLAMVESERSARQALESQVRKLNQRMNMMSTSTTATFRGPSIQLEPPPTAKSFGSLSAFDHDSEDDERDRSGERSLALEDSGVAADGRDDDEYSETFATPREDRPYGFGAFGEELREDYGDGKQKKAARTLSLSQLTIGKNPPPPTNHPTPQGVDSF